MTAAIPVLDEAFVRARVAAFVAENPVPEPERVHVILDLWADDEFMKAICGTVRTATVMVARRSDVATWAAALGAKPSTRHTIFEYDDGSWWAIWTEEFRVAGWLPGVDLTVEHDEDRWIDPPAVER